MNKPITESDLVTPKVTTGPLTGSRKIYSAPEAAPDLRVPLREIALDRSRPASRRCRSTTPPAPTPTRTSRSTSRRACSAHAHRMGEGARRRRGIRRPADQAGRQRQRHAASTWRAISPTRRSRCARARRHSPSRSSNGRAPASSPRR